MTPRFFPYRPSTLRGFLAALAVVATALGTAAVLQALQGRTTSWVRAALAAGLAIAFAWLAWRLRPRERYGVRLDLAGVELARALDGRAERLLWRQIAAVRQVGRWAPRWVVELHDGTSRELPRALFSDPAVWADLGRALTASGDHSASDA
jgi:hypothetical protein